VLKLEVVMRRLARLVLVLVSVVFAPALAYAQAAITGVVRDTSGAVLPGVTVEAASPALIERLRTAVSDATGRYRIEELRPGAYTVTFTLPGFATVRREGLELTGTFVATLNAELRVGAVEETITVTGETPIVDVQSVTNQRVLDQEILDALPTGRTPSTILAVIPGLTAANVDVGGIKGDGSARGAITSRGVGDVQMMIGNVTLQTAGGGTGGWGIVTNLAAYQEMVVDTGGLGAERRESGVRVNLIPRDGGNTFRGSFQGKFANSAMQANNFTQDLQDRGLRTPNTLEKLWELNPAFGGPIMRDRLWFHWTMRHAGAFENVPMFFNKNAGNPDLWTYERDTSRPWANENTVRNWANARFTWQATSKNKIGFTYDASSLCDCPRSASSTRSPEAHMDNYVDLTPRNRWIADWTAPITNRFLLQATAIRMWTVTARPHQNLFLPPGAVPLIQVQEQSTSLTYRATASAHETRNSSLFGNLIASYITGGHAFKVGVDYGWGTQEELEFSPDSPMAFRFNNGVPNRLTLNATPFDNLSRSVDPGLFVQDRWTVDRLTLTLGLRYSYFRTFYPETHVGPAQFAPRRNIVLPETEGVRWHNLLPTSGLAFDLFGDTKTAVKINLGKYLAQQAIRGDIVVGLTPAARLVNTTNRSWNDLNRNFVPDCDLLNPASNGECAATDNPNFGSTEPGLTIDPDVISGWGKTPGYNWQFSAAVQRELLPRVSMEVSYWRTWIGNFLVTDNRTVGPSDYDAFSMTAPVDPRLPEGGGYAIAGVYDIKPGKFGLPVDSFLTSASNFGKQTEHWNGVDITVNARPRPGVLLQGGTTTERRATDNCEIVARLPEVSFSSAGIMPQQYCHVTGIFLTQVKLLGSFTVPRIDVQFSGTFQSMPGPQITANYVAANAEVVPSLGRSLAGGARNVTVALVEPRTLYGERRNQVDLRFGKILRFGRARATASLDLFNVFNASTVLAVNSAFASWQQPQEILQARFAKIGLQLDF
jgi:hypothetical protein